MTKNARLGSFVLALALTAVLAAPAFAGNVYTVGDFVQELAKFRNLNANDAQIARVSLAGVGIRVPTELADSKALTEADVARIARGAGLDVRTSNPDSSFTAEQAQTFLLGFSSDLGQAPGNGEVIETLGGETPDGASGGANGNGPPFDPYSKGKGGSKGKKKGHRTAAEPE